MGSRPLEGLRILVTDFDLQQLEHRGIAVYSKGLIKALKESGAETWLLTDFEPPMRDPGIDRLPRATQKLIFTARVLEALMIGAAGLRSRWIDVKLRSKGGLIGRAAKIWTRLNDIPSQLRLRSNYDLSRMKCIHLHELDDCPYLRQERLSYLKDLDGIICTPRLYFNASRLALRRRPSPVRLKMGAMFDYLITTAPINLSTEDDKQILQTIHDVIPLEYVPHLDHVVLFAERLARTKTARKLFVSTSTKYKYYRAFPSSSQRSGAVIIQPSSLQIPSGPLRTLFSEDVLRPSRHAKARHGELRAFRYLLFNSSVEPRKNLLFIIKAYRLSGLSKLGVRLCVTGQLQKDAYSKAVAEQADESILLTGYIDEATKANLFLHAIAILSPSLVEGFGIPVLDGACIGTPVIASASASHAEIKQLQDFNNKIWLCDTTDPMAWSIAMRDLTNSELSRISDHGIERENRLNRFENTSSEIFNEFKKVLCNEILNEFSG